MRIRWPIRYEISTIDLHAPTLVGVGTGVEQQSCCSIPFTGEGGAQRGPVDSIPAGTLIWIGTDSK